MKKPMSPKVQRAFILSIAIGMFISGFIEWNYMDLTFTESVCFNLAWAIPLGLILRKYRQRVEKNSK
jgi:hypothetical protein